MPQKTKKKSLSNKDTIVKKPSRKNTFTYWDEYHDLYTLKRMPVSEVMIERISIDLLKWASTVTEKPRDKPLILRDFFHAKGIPARTCSKWLNAHPKFKECYEEAKLMIASHREKGGLFKEYDVNMVKARQHAYDPDWKKDEEWRAELKQKTEEHKDITFNIRTVPSSPLVPEKEKNEE